MIYKYMDIFERLVNNFPVPEVDDDNHDSCFDDDEPNGTDENSTSNEELLEKISALENLIAEMKNNNNGGNLQSTSDLHNS